MFRQTDFRDCVFNTRHRMTFFAVEMNMIMKMLLMSTFPATLRKIHHAINIDDLMDSPFVFKSFQNSIDGYSIA